MQVFWEVRMDLPYGGRVMVATMMLTVSCMVTGRLDVPSVDEYKSPAGMSSIAYIIIQTHPRATPGLGVMGESVE